MTTATTEVTFADVLAQRNAIYTFLARLFRTEVDEELLGTLRGMQFPARTGNRDCNAGYRLIVNYLSHAPEDPITDLAIDYVRAFIGGGNNAFSAAYPYESVYTSPKRLMMQDARDEVLAIYRANGLGKCESFKEAEDHLAAELEFMATIGTRAEEALAAGDEDECARLLLTQRNFLEDHLLSWYPMMAEDLQKFARTDFYKGLRRLTTGVLENDLVFLNDVLGAEEEAVAA